MWGIWWGEFGICKNCGYMPKTGSRFEIEKVDIFDLAKALKEKEQEKEAEEAYLTSPEYLEKKKERERRLAIPRLSYCPYCHKHSLFYNSVDDRFECLNKLCTISSKPILSDTEEYKNVIAHLISNSK